MFQVVNDLNPRLSELVPIYYPNHSYSTRNSDHIHGKDRMLECTRLSVVYRGPQIWNNLDNSLKDMKSFSSFKKNLKRLLISHYETEWSPPILGCDLIDPASVFSHIDYHADCLSSVSSHLSLVHLFSDLLHSFATLLRPIVLSCYFCVVYLFSSLFHWHYNI